MKIKIKTSKVNFSMPVPLSMAGAAIRSMPEIIFEEMRRRIPEPYKQLVSKETAIMYFDECKDIFRHNKDLEIVHVEGHDGTYISIVL